MRTVARIEPTTEAGARAYALAKVRELLAQRYTVEIAQASLGEGMGSPAEIGYWLAAGKMKIRRSPWIPQDPPQFWTFSFAQLAREIQTPARSTAHQLPLL